MRKLKGTLLTLLAEQSGQIQLLIVAPILTLSFLSLVVRTASSAVDSSSEKRRVTEQLKRRLSEVQNERPRENENIRVAARPKETTPVKALSPQKIQKTLSPSALPTKSESLAQQLLLPLQATLKVGKKSSLAALLNSEGIEKDESASWLTAAKKHRELQKLVTGRSLELSFVLSKKDKERELRTLSYELDRKTRLILEKKADGKINARREALPILLVWKGVGGRITGSLYKSAIRAGVPKQLVDDFADMDWDIDLASDLQQGDTFKVIFEEFQLDGKPIDLGKILAAEINNKGRTYTLFSFPEPRSIIVPGSGAHGAFLRYPLQFTKITSVFTDARLHPILERVRPHTGVDFAAPRGTPVRAIANGKVSFAGRQSGYGNIVRIDHPGPYDTAYAHLDRIAEAVREGASVEKGQVIGFVGSTGLATGPHLHFEMYKDGEFINPMTAKIITEDNLQKKENPAFLAKKQRALEQFSAMKVTDQPIILSLAFPQSSKAASREVALKGQDERLALATSTRSPSLISGLSSVSEEKLERKKFRQTKSSQVKKGRRTSVLSSRQSASVRSAKTVKTTSKTARGVRTARR